MWMWMWMVDGVDLRGWLSIMVDGTQGREREFEDELEIEE